MCQLKPSFSLASYDAGGCSYCPIIKLQEVERWHCGTISSRGYVGKGAEGFCWCKLGYVACSSLMQQKKDLVGTDQGRPPRTTTSLKAPPNQHKSMKKPSPLMRKVKPKSPLESKHRKTAGGTKSVKANDSGAAGSLPHSGPDEGVKSDGHEEKEVALSSVEKQKTQKESRGYMELKEEKPDGNSLSNKEE